MLSTGLREWQQTGSFRMEGNAVYGVYQNVGFSVVEEDGGKLFVFMLSGKDEAFDSLEDLLCNQSGELNAVQVGDVENYLALFFDESVREMSSGGMSGLLDFVAGNFRACGFKAPTVCVRCGAPANKRTFLNNMVQPMCADCREAQKLEKARKTAAPAINDNYVDHTIAPDPRRGQQPPRRAELDYDDGYGYAGPAPRRDERAVYPDEHFMEKEALSGEGSAPSGFFGALLGALAGLAPYILLVTAADFELAALCFLAGIGAVLGYVAFGGMRERKNAMTTVFAVSEIVSLFVVLLKNAAENMQNGFSTMLSDLFTVSWLSLLLAAIGALLGVMVSLDRLTKYLTPASGR